MRLPTGQAGGAPAAHRRRPRRVPRAHRRPARHPRRKTLLERGAPRVAGDPEVTWPDALAGDAVSLSWRSPAEDAVASFGYSNDGGATWQPLSLPTREETVVFDARALPGGDRCLLELTVTDGFHTTRVQSKEYEVTPRGWVLWILAPAAGASLRSDAPVLLAAHGYHIEERRASSRGSNLAARSLPDGSEARRLTLAP